MKISLILPKRTIVFALCVLVSVPACGGEIPRYWYKTMRNSPDANYALRKYAEPLDNKLASEGRNIVLALMLSTQCQGASLNKRNLKEYIAKSGLAEISEAKRQIVSGQVESVFIQFDYRDLAHLCAGIEYMFGSKGSLASSILKTGSGKPVKPYEGFGGYMRPPLLADVLRGVKKPKGKQSVPLRI